MTTSEAETLAAAGVSLGAPRDHMVLEPQSWDTFDEVRMLRAMLGDDRFVLVTSAMHMSMQMGPTRGTLRPLTRQDPLFDRLRCTPSA